MSLRPPARSTDDAWVPLKMQQEALACGAYELFLGGAAGPGKGLALDTPIPTPSGWTTMGELSPGDEVFGGDGRVCRVVRVSAIHHRSCFRLGFDDGTTLTADDVHRWVTLTEKERGQVLRRSESFRADRRSMRAPRGTGARPHQAAANTKRAEGLRDTLSTPPEPQVRDTAELHHTLLTRRGRANHTIALTAPLCLPEGDLLVDPYVLGVWLGDGTSGGGSITSGDQEILDRVSEGYATGFTSRKRTTAAVTQGFYGLRTHLRVLGVLGNKHIPMGYLRASYAQRLELLRGLVDSDGHVDQFGTVEFCNTNKTLALNTLELARSLGLKPGFKEGVARLSGRDCGPKYRVTWTSTLQTSWVPRKACHTPTTTRPWVTSHRYLLSVDPVESVPTRCIQVDSPDHTFLAGEGFTPTHNSEFLVVAPLRWVHHPTFRAILFRNSFPELQRTLIAKSRKIYSRLGAQYNETNHTWTFPSGATIEFAYLESDRDVYRYQGAEFQFAGFDELAHFTEFCYRYISSRLRGTAGVPIRLRSTGNPDGPHLEWVRRRWALWIDKQVDAGKPVWFSPDGKVTEKGTPFALSRCYIPGRLRDNPYLPEEYVAQLMALDPITRAKLLDGDWDAVMGKGSLFHRDWWHILDAAPPCPRRVRSWDFGASVDGDPTVGLLMGDRGLGVTPRYVVLDVVSAKAGPTDVHALVKKVAQQDGTDVLITIPQDPGAAGKDVVASYQKELAGWYLKIKRPDRKKTVRAGPFSSQVGAKNVGVVRATWTPAFIAELHAFPEGNHDDQVDAASDAFSELALVGQQQATEDYHFL